MFKFKSFDNLNKNNILGKKKRQNLLQQTKCPDYSWLMDWRLKTKKILGFRVIFNFFNLLI